MNSLRNRFPHNLLAALWRTALDFTMSLADIINGSPCRECNQTTATPGCETCERENRRLTGDW